jgi:hypothetical protein
MFKAVPMYVTLIDRLDIFIMKGFFLFLTTFIQSDNETTTNNMKPFGTLDPGLKRLCFCLRRKSHFSALIVGLAVDMQLK